jgi:hypothetical protein
MAHLGNGSSINANKSMIMTSKKSVLQSGARKEAEKSNPRDSREPKRKLWFSSLVLALLIAFILLAFDFSSLTVQQWKLGQVAATDVYSPSRLTITDGTLTVDYLSGEVVVRKGEKITAPICVALNVISDQSRFSALPRTIGFLLLLLVIGHIINKFFKVNDIKWLENKRSLNLFLVTLTLTIMGIKLIGYFGGTFQTFVLLNPVPVASILLALLLGYDASTIATIVLAPIFGIIVAGGGQSMAVAYALLGSFGASLMVGPTSSVRKDIFKATVLLSAVNGTLLFSFILFNYLPGSQVPIAESWALFVSGLLNGALVFLVVTGLVPLLEKSFEVTTVSTLQQLIDPSQPLMKRLISEAPGTFHHSLNVATLAEAAARVIGCSGDLARAGAMYHDIGKLKRPLFFSENQHGGVYYHDNMSPHLSCLIITSHRKDGVEMAEKEGLPESICDIISQHHGTDLVSYFFHGAKQNEGKGEIDEQSFRYPGPKPQSKEAAIVMLADSCEAATRSLQNPTSGTINKLVTKITNDRYIDGQFDECYLNKKEIKMVSECLTLNLAGMYHSRVAYPDENDLIAKPTNRQEQPLSSQVG